MRTARSHSSRKARRPLTNKNKVGKVTRKQVEEIAKTKLKDLTAKDVAAAMKTVEGTARSMGIEITE